MTGGICPRQLRRGRDPLWSHATKGKTEMWLKENPEDPVMYDGCTKRTAFIGRFQKKKTKS